MLGRQLGKSKVSPRSCTPGRRPILVSVSCTESDVVVAVSFKLTRRGYSQIFLQLNFPFKTRDLNACFGVSVWLMVSIAGTPFGSMCSRLSTDLLL